MGKSLFQPYALGEMKLKNRIAMAPMTRGRAGESRVANELMAQYYYQRGSAGLLITEATVISPQGIGWIGSPGIYTAEMVAGWQKVTERVKPSGAKMFLQLWHCGRASHSDFHKGELPFSASAIRLNGDYIHTPAGKKEYETPRAMTVADIKATVDDYRRAAANAKDAGFDGIEIHSANGYLLNQFLDSKTNLRNDQYGGSLENKFRFLREVLEAVFEIWPPGRVGVRLSPNGIFNDMGSDDFRETYLYVARELNKLSPGYVHIMDGLAFGFHNKGEPMTLDEFRKCFTGTIIGNCGYTLNDAEQRMTGGQADIAAFGRPFISNPDLVARMKNGWPLAPYDDMTFWYTSGAEGYTDYPFFSE
ncbi:alkene reductase [Desulforhopalus singaporensis]|uniref:N-ethylmaleimide reductase n=1 Tax=Desulforhopalus singaporensis TaxID=91360 RepID=A0A1H0NP49_9BACT|nr:alkene reductase [Desulforhopalus singaporensis]SDO94542.1 N-ethylmaleimide reductase [Desulforhopalus singaporensis]